MNCGLLAIEISSYTMNRLNVQHTFPQRVVVMLGICSGACGLNHQPSVSVNGPFEGIGSRKVSVLQGEIYVSSMTCLGKNTANIWIHQVALEQKRCSH